jgi:hypothetical protein
MAVDTAMDTHGRSKAAENPKWNLSSGTAKYATKLPRLIAT